MSEFIKLNLQKKQSSSILFCVKLLAGITCEPYNLSTTAIICHCDRKGLIISWAKPNLEQNVKYYFGSIIHPGNKRVAHNTLAELNSSVFLPKEILLFISSYFIVQNTCKTVETMALFNFLSFIVLCNMGLLVIPVILNQF